MPLYRLIPAILVFSSAVLAKPITVLTEHLAPYQIVAEDGAITGEYTAKIEAGFESANIPYELHSNPWAISYAHTLKDNNTCLYSVARTKEREAQLVWIAELGKIEAFFYSEASKDISLNTFEDAKNYTVAAIEGDVSYEHLLSNGFISGQNLYPVENYHSLVDLLSKRSADIDLIMLNDVLLENRHVDAKKRTKFKKHEQFSAMTIRFYLACNPAMSAQITSRLRNAFASQ